MDLEGHYPQNTISHCIISNETQITLHFYQGRISAMPEIGADLFLAISKTGICFYFKPQLHCHDFGHDGATTHPDLSSRDASA